ncbi:MAG: thiamine-phosphate kinase [Alphaproteobacteria bacterium]|nr:thiamine-phosphate kinase [Alphaproteobacteria bacterium]MCB9931046.1 thiamine-phosphate kinase [Alphaproteobacteria bacterium]
MTSPPLDEFGLIARYLAPLATHPGADGLHDDVAVLARASLAGDLVLTTDAIVAGVHFLEDEDPRLVAERLLRANLSDLAAKGARPIGYQLTLALTVAEDAAWLEAFTTGLRANQTAFDWSLLGGDTVRTPGPLTLSLTALGELAAGTRAPRRGGAKAGDAVWVTGWIGDGALGLAVAKGEAGFLPPHLAGAAEAKFRLPQPRVAFGLALAGVATASADVSDGLVADLGHIAEASGLGAAIEADAVPLSAAGRAAVAHDPAWLARLLSGGDDYEIVFTAPPAAEAAIRTAGAASGLAVTRIGSMTAGEGVSVRRGDGTPLAIPDGGYHHF